MSEKVNPGFRQTEIEAKKMLEERAENSFFPKGGYHEH
jgi:hypothetical protein